MTYDAKAISGGKIVIPADLRRKFGMKDGDSLVIERDAHGGLAIKTYAQVVREVQAEFRRLRTPGNGISMVDELIAERRENARREAEDSDRWANRGP